MPTVSDLIHSSFRLIGAIAAGEQLEAAELNDALVSLNQMFVSWNTEGLSVMGRQRIFETVMVGQNTYPIPLTGRPLRIEAASVAVNGIDCPLEIVDAAGWEAITEKLATAILIKKLFCDYYWPSTSIYIWPTPRALGQLEMFIYQQFAVFGNINDEITLPPGYEQAIRYNFAVALLPEYPRSQVDPTLLAQAQNFKASLVQLNALNLQISQSPTAATVAAQGNS